MTAAWKTNSFGGLTLFVGERSVGTVFPSPSIAGHWAAVLDNQSELFPTLKDAKAAVATKLLVHLLDEVEAVEELAGVTMVERARA